MTTSRAIACTYQGPFGPGGRIAILKLTWQNNYTTNGTIDLSSTNGSSITMTSPEYAWQGFSTVYGAYMSNPYSTNGTGYVGECKLSSTTLTTMLMIGNFDASDGPLIQASAGAIADDMTSWVIVWGN